MNHTYKTPKAKQLTVYTDDAEKELMDELARFYRVRNRNSLIRLSCFLTLQNAEASGFEIPEHLKDVNFLDGMPKGIELLHKLLEELKEKVNNAD